VPAGGISLLSSEEINAYILYGDDYSDMEIVLVTSDDRFYGFEQVNTSVIGGFWKVYDLFTR
jgi:hypothetical protein